MKRWGDDKVVGRCTSQVTRAETGRPNGCLAVMKLPTLSSVSMLVRDGGMPGGVVSRLRKFLLGWRFGSADRALV